MFVIGITGSLGSGKSTVARMFAEYGAIVLDADCIAHNKLKKGEKSFQKVIKTFGKQILTGENIDHRKLAHIVFNDYKQLKKLENILHPEVCSEIIQTLKEYKKTEKIIVMDVPLLFESGLDKFTDLIVVVKSKENLQISRAMKRLGITREEALKRRNVQMSFRDKIQRADVVLDNSGNLNQIKEKVGEIWKKYF